MVFAQFEELNVITGTGLHLLYAWLIVDPVIEDILVLEEQDFNPSLVVVAVSGWEPVGGQSVPSVDFVNQTKLFGEASSVGQSVQVETSSKDNAVQIGILLGVPDIQQFKAQVVLVAVVGVESLHGGRWSHKTWSFQSKQLLFT